MRASNASYKEKAASAEGFTMLELAIVMVIVGLLIGGVLSGRSLLEASETRAIYTDAQRYMSSVSQFVDKYGSLPGDMYNAEDIWGQAAAGATCDTTNNNDKTTCNGDGNGRIALGTTDNGTNESAEHFRAWQQLYNAGLLEVSMTGISGSGGVNHAQPSTNVPKGIEDGTGYTLYVQGTGGGDFFNATDEYGHILLFGQYTAADVTEAPALLPERAYEIDLKIDDGAPGTGTVRTYINTSQNDCATTDDETTATYDTTYDDDRACNVIFITGF